MEPRGVTVEPAPGAPLRGLPLNLLHFSGSGFDSQCGKFEFFYKLPILIPFSPTDHICLCSKWVRNNKHV